MLCNIYNRKSRTLIQISHSELLVEARINHDSIWQGSEQKLRLSPSDEESNEITLEIFYLTGRLRKLEGGVLKEGGKTGRIDRKYFLQRRDNFRVVYNSCTKIFFLDNGLALSGDGYIAGFPLKCRIRSACYKPSP